MTVDVSLRRNQATPLTWNQVDDNFQNLANAVGASGNMTISGGTTASRPVSPLQYNTFYFDTDLGLLIMCSEITPSVVWVNMAGYPV